MRLGYALAVAASLIALSVTGGYAQGDAAEGEKLGREWCTRCHNVEPGGSFKQYPPSFTAIAVYRSPEQIYGMLEGP
jgi:cytochrome c2